MPPLKPASEAFLYPGQWSVSPIRHLKSGLVEFELYGMGAADRLRSAEAALQAETRNAEVHSFRFQLQPDRNWFELQGETDVRKFSLTYAPPERYTRNGSSQAPDGFVSAAFFGIQESAGGRSQVVDWTVDFAAASLPASMALPPASGDASLPELGRAYGEWLEGRQGWPSDEVIRADAATAARLVSEGKARIWCGNISNIFLLAAQRAGAQARAVSLMNITGAVTTSGHVTNEIYLPGSRRWQLADFTLGFFSAQDHGRPLNTLELHRILADAGSPRDGLSFAMYDAASRQFRPTSWSQLPAETRDLVEAFYGRGAQLLYRYHPNVGKERRTLWVRLRNRLFDDETMMVYAPNVEALAALTWYDVHVYGRTLSIVSLLAVTLAWMRQRREARRRRRAALRSLQPTGSQAVLPGPRERSKDLPTRLQ